MILYSVPSSVESSLVQQRPALHTPQGGRIAADSVLVSLWRCAKGRTVDEIISDYPPKEEAAIRAALACLAEAGLLTRTISAPQQSPEKTTGELVSVIIIAYNSRDWLKECLPTLFDQTYSPLEIIVVDNFSSDQSAEWLKAAFPQVRVVPLKERCSFASALNRGVQTVTGPFFLLLNPDVRLEQDAIAQMIDVTRASDSPVIVAAKLKFTWAPGFLNGLGNRVGAVSWGTDNAIGHLDLGQFDSWRELPSACFAAALIPRSIWDAVGPIDEGFPMYYEDIEWCYRARLIGNTIRAAPQAVVYHAFGGHVPAGEDRNLSPFKLRNVAFGRLRFTIKILGWRFLLRFLLSYSLEDGGNFLRALLVGRWQTATAYLGAWSAFLKCLPSLVTERRRLQARRRCSDAELFALQRDMPRTFMWQGLPELTWDLVRDHYLPLFLSGRTRPMPEFSDVRRRPHLLVVSHDIVDTKMGGVGMRYVEMARVLSADLDVTLAVPSETTFNLPNVPLVRYWEERPASLQILVENSDVALISGYMIKKFPFLATTRARLVVDLYDPFFLENLHYYLNEPLEAQAILNHQAIDIANRLARIGDFFICGSERQRDFWMGVLAANERINPYTFKQDPSLRALIDLVGIGFPEREPVHRPILRGVHAAFSNDTRIVLWGGGIWDWLDPLTLVRAWPSVIERHPDARLVFLGTRHPNPLVPSHRLAEQTQSLAAEIGEKDRTIFFYEWLSYEEREALLCEADIGVALHPLHVETRYSIRTRVLDYLWARLPVLVSDGDVTSEWVRQYRVGQVVPPLDVEAVAQALTEMLDKPKSEWSAAFAPLRQSMSWFQMVEPLKRYCLQGGYASDRQARDRTSPCESRQEEKIPLTRAVYIWKTAGFRILLHRAKRYIQWRLASV